MTDEPAPAEWMTTAWFRELTGGHERIVLTPSGLAGLMALFSSPERLRLRLDELPAVLPVPWHDPLFDGLPTEVAAAFEEMRRLNEWAILTEKRASAGGWRTICR